MFFREMSQNNYYKNEAKKISSNNYYENEEKFIEVNQKNFKDYWSCYYAYLIGYKPTLENKSTEKPAIVFSRLDKDEAHINLKAKVAKVDDGRVYKPGDTYSYYHCWEFNLAWVLAQTHIKRPFLIVSIPLKEEYLYQVKDTTKYSGFALEISAAVKAGYQFDCRGDDLYLIPPQETPKKLLSIADIYPSSDEIKQTLSCLKKALEKPLMTLSR
jgi:hypothetical protein